MRVLALAAAGHRFCPGEMQGSSIRGFRRAAIEEPISELMERFDLMVEVFPADAWRIAARLPPIHRDPVDRMLIAHALAEGMTLLTADANICRYPVPFA